MNPRRSLFLLFFFFSKAEERSSPIPSIRCYHQYHFITSSCAIQSHANNHTHTHTSPCVMHRGEPPAPARRTGSVLCCTPRLLVEVTDGGNPRKKEQMDLPLTLPHDSASGLLRCYRLPRLPPAADWLSEADQNERSKKDKGNSGESVRGLVC